MAGTLSKASIAKGGRKIASAASIASIHTCRALTDDRLETSPHLSRSILHHFHLCRSPGQCLLPDLLTLIVAPLSRATQRNSRVRNREHARNTRIRKKQYVESLKLQVGEMLQAKAQEERDAQLETSKISAKVRGGEGRTSFY